MSSPIPLASSSAGRVSGKSWKATKTATVSADSCFNSFHANVSNSRSNLPDAVKTKRWEDRMQKTTKAMAIKKLQTELKDEKEADYQRFTFCFTWAFLPLIPPPDGGRLQWSAKRRQRKGGDSRTQKRRYEPSFRNESQSHSMYRWAQEKLHGCVEGQGERKRSTIDMVCR